jgi:hypothetical protein
MSEINIGECLNIDNKCFHKVNINGVISIMPGEEIYNNKSIYDNISSKLKEEHFYKFSDEYKKWKMNNESTIKRMRNNNKDNNVLKLSEINPDNIVECNLNDEWCLATNPCQHRINIKIKDKEELYSYMLTSLEIEKLPYIFNKMPNSYKKSHSKFNN